MRLSDISKVKTYIKPKADSTLCNMRKTDLIEYIRTLEHNYNVAVSFNENQAKYIESIPQDAVPVVHGRWDYFGGDDDMGLYGFCSECQANWDEEVVEKFKFCPNCGSKMDGGNEDGTAQT